MKVIAADVSVIEAGPSSIMAESLILVPASVVVRLTTDNDIEGIGSATANLGGAAIGRATADLTRLVMGADPMYRERIWQQLMAACIAVYPPQAVAAIDCALWDLI